VQRRPLIRINGWRANARHCFHPRGVKRFVFATGKSEESIEWARISGILWFF
jgi:hypothetical protein